MKREFFRKLTIICFVMSLAAATAFPMNVKAQEEQRMKTLFETRNGDVHMVYEIAGMNTCSEEVRLMFGKRLEDKINDELIRSAEETEAVKQEVEMQAKEAKEERERKQRDQRNHVGVVRYSANDYEVLQRIVQAEAGGQDKEGKMLVANVILNRVRSSNFPNNITDVVYEPKQFTPVMTGAINTVKVSDETRECVARALAGEDYSQGATYFMNRRTAAAHNSSWFDRSLTFVRAHGGHEFFKEKR